MKIILVVRNQRLKCSQEMDADGGILLRMAVRLRRIHAEHLIRKQTEKRIQQETWTAHTVKTVAAATGGANDYL
jgi:hypothetical protein